MNINIREYSENDLPDMIAIWNEVVEEEIAFPQEEMLTIETGREFFGSQTYTGVAYDSDTGVIYGLYILHPNNIGRCGHICNASYAVRSDSRGLHIGEKLVSDCIKQGAYMASECYSLMQWLPQTFTQDTCMRDWDLNSLEL